MDASDSFYGGGGDNIVTPMSSTPNSKDDSNIEDWINRKLDEGIGSPLQKNDTFKSYNSNDHLPEFEDTRSAGGMKKAIPLDYGEDEAEINRLAGVMRSHVIPNGIMLVI